MSTSGRYCVLVVGFLGWFGAGVHMSITQLTGQAAARDLLIHVGEIDEAWRDSNPRIAMGLLYSPRERNRTESLLGRWFAWYQCAFLFGAATGGLLFGWLGDKIGRAKGMAASIIAYSAFAGAAYFSQTPQQLLVLWYLACTGVGGMWPNGVALVNEAWAGLSRPLVAGIIGTSANIGILMFATLAAEFKITSEQWRWAMLVGACPLALGIFAWFAVPESPRWLATWAASKDLATAIQAGPPSIMTSKPPTPAAVSIGDVFSRPYFKITLVGIMLATVPVMGGWGVANWMIPWAESVTNDPYMKANIQQARSITGIIGSLLGGWIASQLGRRKTYVLASLCSLTAAQYTFWALSPKDDQTAFLLWVAALGFFSGIFFGWLPLCLPELFPTKVRSAGAGVSFNFGRIFTACTLFFTGIVIRSFEGDYARIGRVTSLFYALGILAICLAPDTSKRQLED